MEPDDDPASPNFSVHIADDGDERGAKQFHVLYRGTTAVVRTRSLRRLVDSLVAYLSAAVEGPDDRTLRLEVLALVKDGAAALAPARIRSALPSIERRLNAKGLRVVDRPWACVDVTTGELVVGEPDLTVDRSALAGLPATRGPDQPVPPGRYPVVGWGFGLGREQRGPISRPLAVTLAGPQLLDRATLHPQLALDQIVSVLARLQPAAVWADAEEELVGPLVELASGPMA